MPALDDLLNLVLASQARRAARNLLQGVAADLLDCLAFILSSLLAARRQALLGSALERRDFVVIILVGRRPMPNFVAWPRGVGVLVEPQTARWSFDEGPGGRRIVRFGRFRTFRQRSRP